MPTSTNSTTQIIPGGPESPGIPIQPKTPERGGQVVAPGNNESKEFGYDRIKQIEKQQDESLRDIERKDRRRVSPTPKPDPQQQQQKKQDDKPKKTTVVGPKFFGYRISTQTTDDVTGLKDKKGKGDATDAKTWVYMLLDRMLKKQTYSNDN